jgi:DHA1 family bicyclomycin/chloramphenicol resistance-like MFS transporter
MSFIMTVFILVPVLAPSLGQLILFVGDWRTIFETLIVMTIAAMIWTAIRQPETLPAEGRPPFTFRKLRIAFGIVLGNRVTMIATVVSGLIFGAFFSYLNVSQQILQVQYQLGEKFPLYFAILAIGVGCASLLNSSLVMKFGMHHLASLSLAILVLLSWGFFLMVLFFSGHPPLWMFMAAFFVMFFAIGVLFGNLNAIAMEPLGEVAGTGAAVVGSVSSLIAVLLGFLFGNAYNGTLFPMAISFALLSTISLLMIYAIRHLWKE